MPKIVFPILDKYNTKTNTQTKQKTKKTKLYKKSVKNPNKPWKQRLL